MIKEWTDYLNKSYINTYGIGINIFKIDKEATPIDLLYMEEERTGRVYTPPFPMKCLQDDGKWTNFLGLKGFEQKEVPLVMFINFNDMVNTIRGLKEVKKSEIIIKTKSTKRFSIEKIYNVINIYKENTLLVSYDIENKNYNSTSKLGSYINMLDDLECIIVGENDYSNRLLDFDRTYFTKEISFYTLDETYKNMTDVIEIGDVIVTNKFRAYEVMNGFPAGDFAWSYNTWKLETKLIDIEKANLPNNYVELIRRNEYGYRSKVNLEGQFKNLGG